MDKLKAECYSNIMMQNLGLRTHTKKKHKHKILEIIVEWNELLTKILIFFCIQLYRRHSAIHSSTTSSK